MTTPCRLLAAGLLLGAAISGCGDDDDAASTTTFSIDTPAQVPTSAAGTSFPTVPTIGPVPGATGDIPIAPSGSGDIPFVPSDTTEAPVLIDVVVGEGTGPDRVEVVPLGTLVTLNVVNNDAADEFHLAGYDLGIGQQVAAGSPASFTFTAGTAGDFELTGQASGGPLLILRVQ